MPTHGCYPLNFGNHSSFQFSVSRTTTHDIRVVVTALIKGRLFGILGLFTRSLATTVIDRQPRTMKSLLLFLILGGLLPTVTPVQAVTELSGKHCSHEGVCCKNEETCCATGCCPQATFCCPKVPGCCKYPHCCPKGSKTGCCPTNASVCCPKQGGCCTESFPVCGESKCYKAGATSAEESIEMFIDTTTLSTNINITATTTNTVKKQPFVDFPVFTSLPGPCNTVDVEKNNEGNYSCVYKDPKNIPTIGIGFNLIKKGAKEQIEGVGADYSEGSLGTN